MGACSTTRWRDRCRRLPVFLLFAGLGALASPASAQNGERRISAQDVLTSSATHYPAILESLAQRRSAEGELLESEGAFDIVFSASGSGRMSGYYDGAYVRGGVQQSLPMSGTRVYADYGLSRGQFPIYEDSRYTNEGGELKLGVLFSLLRDRHIDEPRFNRMDAQLAVRQADLELLLTRIGVQRQALVTYWRWVAAGQMLDVYSNLLAIARDRQAGLEEQVRTGAQAEIFLVENQQNITRRETFVASARRDLSLAANELSMYFRDASGNPVVPSVDQLPVDPEIGVFEAFEDSTNVGSGLALARRPELALLRTALDRARNRSALASNALKPRVDLTFELARDVGALAEGGPSRDGTDSIVGVQFEFPLQQRTGRGRVRRANADIEAIEQRGRLQEDRIVLEVERIRINLEAAEDLLELAAVQVDQTQLVRDAEQRRFENGASDFFVVNVREETAANALIDYHSAHLQHRMARADYDSATVDFDRLGLPDEIYN